MLVSQGAQPNMYESATPNADSASYASVLSLYLFSQSGAAPTGEAEMHRGTVQNRCSFWFGHSFVLAFPTSLGPLVNLHETESEDPTAALLVSWNRSRDEPATFCMD